ncbi:MAG: DivIVA domain-containing protein [Nitrospirae bacterium]|nr:DivIVA domain-containing protein [Nitrospirota bacterium]
MRITPLDIQQRKFRKKFKGYDLEEVHSFLQLISEEVEEVRRENAALKEEARGTENQLKEFLALEVALRDTVIKTQEFVETYRESTRKNAELLQKDAELKAEEILKELQQKIVKIHEEITSLKGIRKHFKEQMTELIESYLGKVEVR